MSDRDAARPADAGRPLSSALSRATARLTARVDVRPVLVGLGVGVLAHVLGLGRGDALLVGLVAFVVTHVAMSLEGGATHEWPAVDPTETDGTRREVSALTWTFLGRDGRVSEPAVRRLREVATHRLRRAGVAVPVPVGPALAARAAAGEPRAEEARRLLGERIWLLLTGPGGYLPTVADVAHCVDVLDALVPATDPRRTPETRPPTERHRP